MRVAICLAFLMISRLAAQTAFVTGAGYTAPPAIAVAPGQIATFYIGGLPQTGAALTSTAAQLSNGTVTEAVIVLSAKPVNSTTLAITVQIPFDVAPAAAGIAIQFGQSDTGQGNLCSQNTCTSPVSLTVVATLPHIITTCDVFYSVSTGTCQLAVTHQDGSLVTTAAPGKVGEILTVWSLGLGVPLSGIPAPGSGPIAMNDIVLSTEFALTSPLLLSGVAVSPSTPYLWAGLSSPATGLYQINFVVPEPPAAVQSCTPSSEWFTGSGNMYVSVFRFVTLPQLSGPTLTLTTGDFVTFLGSSPADSVSSICVSQ